MRANIFRFLTGSELLLKCAKLSRRDRRFMTSHARFFWRGKQESFKFKVPKPN